MSHTALSAPQTSSPVLRRVRVKICGITCEADALAAIDAGADALGFNTWEGSKRYLDLEAARDWISSLPGFVSRVALCINAPRSQALRVAALPFVDAVQFHGDETREDCAAFAAGGRSFLRAVRLGSARDITGLDGWSTRQVLVDAAVAGAYGGTGTLVDKELVALALARFPRLSLTVAGGLEPGNVGELLRELRPYAVDVASGVEVAPGRKDSAKMRDFVQVVREL